jgi:1,4-alpha-glucan branching enzyme
MSDSFKWEFSFGAQLIGPEQTRFTLFAPAQEAISLEVDGRGSFPMQRVRDGTFEMTFACGAGTRYRYRLASGLAVPDPASRAQANAVHDWSVVVDPGAYGWRTPWLGRPWQETVLYELHAGLLGGFRGVEKELPRLSALGITAVELMPVNEFPGRRNWGYDGVLPFAPDAAYGSPDDLKALVDAAHAHGMMMFLDVVYNHFGPDGNYLGSYAPQFFRDDLKTPWGPAIDFRLPEVRRFFTENAIYWLMEYRFDGLRFDAVHAISESDWLDEMAHAVRETVEPQRHVHLVLENEANRASHLRGQIGNRAFGERLTTLADPRALEAAIALQLLTPQIPLIFMGEETASETPFSFFTDHHGALADAVREGRRREFAKFPDFADPARREKIPDPNDVGTFERSVPHPAGRRGKTRGDLYRRLLGLRATEIVPRFPGSRSAGASAVGPAAVVARWKMGDGALLTLACNLGKREAPLAEHASGQLLFESDTDVAKHALAGTLTPYATVAFLDRQL